MTNQNTCDCKNQVEQKLYNEYHKDDGDHSNEKEQSKADLSSYTRILVQTRRKYICAARRINCSSLIQEHHAM